MKTASILFRTLPAAALLLLAPFAAHADNLSLVFIPSTQTVAPAGTITFSGTITNTSNTTVFVNGDSFTGLNSLLSFDDTAFVSATPFSLAPGTKYPVSGSANLFDITLDGTATMGSSYSGIFNILGGANQSAQDIQGNAAFTVTAAAVPETSTTLSFGLLLTAAGVLAVKIRTRSAAAQS